MAMLRYSLVAIICALVGCAYNVSPEGQRALASMTTEQAVKIVRENLVNDEAAGLGICAVPRFNPDTRTPRFQSADPQQFTYLDNRGGAGCTNNCPDPDHRYVVRYAEIRRIFISRTETVSLCRQGAGLDVIQIVGDHEDRQFVMSTVRSENLTNVLAAFQFLNPKIALKNSY